MSQVISVRAAVLLDLLSGPNFGIGIGERIAELSGDRLRLSTGLVSTTINQLLAESLIEECDGEENTSSSNEETMKMKEKRMPNDPNDRAFSTEEIAGILGIDKTTAYGLVRACMELEACRQVGTRRAPSGKGKGTNLYAFNPDAGITLAAAIDKILKIS